jgi:O-acetyl-ADP-ribose deacetylase (regulator of RNase III)
MPFRLNQLPWIGKFFTPSYENTHQVTPSTEDATTRYELTTKTEASSSTGSHPRTAIASKLDVRTQAILGEKPDWTTQLRAAGIRSFQIKSSPIPGLETAVFEGDMTRVPADAYVVPHFRSKFRDGHLLSGVSMGGVGGAIIRAGAEAGLRKYDDLIYAAGREQVWGEAMITESGGGKSRMLVNVVRVGSEVDEEFAVVQQAVFTALMQSSLQGIDTIVFPLMGTGVIGQLTATQSAKAMLSALAQFRSIFPDSFPRQIAIAIYGNPEAFTAVSKVLNLSDEQLSKVPTEKGQKQFDFVAWISEMQRDYSGG